MCKKWTKTTTCGVKSCRSPWKTPEQEARFLEETERETVKLYKIFDQSPEEARRKGDGTWVSYYQRFLKRGHRMQLAWRRLKNRLRR